MYSVSEIFIEGSLLREVCFVWETLQRRRLSSRPQPHRVQKRKQKQFFALPREMDPFPSTQEQPEVSEEPHESLGFFCFLSSGFTTLSSTHPSLSPGSWARLLLPALCREWISLPVEHLKDQRTALPGPAHSHEVSLSAKGPLSTQPREVRTEGRARKVHPTFPSRQHQHLRPGSWL